MKNSEKPKKEEKRTRKTKDKAKKNKTRKPERNIIKTKQNERKKESKKRKKVILSTQPIFPNDFSHEVYLFLHQILLSTNHLRY